MWKWMEKKGGERGGGGDEMKKSMNKSKMKKLK